MLHNGAQVGEVQQRQSRLVGVVEDQAEGGLLGLVEPEHPRLSRTGPNDDIVARNGMPVPSPPIAKYSTG